MILHQNFFLPGLKPATSDLGCLPMTTWLKGRFPLKSVDAHKFLSDWKFNNLATFLSGSPKSNFVENFIKSNIIVNFIYPYVFQVGGSSSSSSGRSRDPNKKSNWISIFLFSPWKRRRKSLFFNFHSHFFQNFEIIVVGSGWSCLLIRRSRVRILPGE